MNIRSLVIRNTLRHPLRSTLTAAGIAIALLAFCLIRTIIDSWYAGVNSSSKNRVIVRNSVSLVFYLPISYGNSIRQVPGVEKVSHANWFGANYKEEKYRFAQFAVSPEYLDIYPEYTLPPEQRRAWEQDKKGALVGAEVAERLGLKVGDVFQLKGTIFPGLWEFVIHGVFRRNDDSGDTRLVFFHWDYLNERNKAEIQRQPDHAGFFAVQIQSSVDPAQVSQAIDARFANSFAETLTETETAFRQGFVSMSATIIMALNAIAGVVIVIMLLVLSNTMIMSARERYREYSILKALGFGKRELFFLVFGESFVLSACGCILLAAALIPIFSLPPRAILGALADFLPGFRLSLATIALSLGAALAVGSLAALVPTLHIMRLKVTDGLRKLG